MRAEEITGRTEGHLCAAAEAVELGAPVHRDVVEPFLRLRGEARRSGFEPVIFSGFRSFDRQLSIWNRKATGELPVLDSRAVPLDIEQLGNRRLVLAILRWSALPGGSRHHWGTDLDVVDGNALPEGYHVQLVPEEVDTGGIFGPFHGWLDQRIASSSAFGFFRPYDADRGGVAPERWHLSHAPVASAFEEALTVEQLRAVITDADMELKETVLMHLDEIYRRFVVNTARPPSL